MKSVLLFLVAHLTTAGAWLTCVPLLGNNGFLQGRDVNHPIVFNHGIATRTNKFPGTALGDTTPGLATKLPPFATIIGNGRIGQTLARAGECTVLKRDDPIDAEGEGPIIVATRNDDLRGVIKSCPERRRKDLVFIQNVYIDDFLKRQNLASNTRALLYFAVPAIGDDPIDGVTEHNPEGLTVVAGKHSRAVVDRLKALGLRSHMISSDRFRVAMFEKLIWLSAYTLVGTVHNCMYMAHVEVDHEELVDSVINELLTAVHEKVGIVFPSDTLQRMKAYTEVVRAFPCEMKELKWRNLYFYHLLYDPEETSVHNTLLWQLAAEGRLSGKIPLALNEEVNYVDDIVEDISL